MAFQVDRRKDAGRVGSQYQGLVRRMGASPSPNQAMNRLEWGDGVERGVSFIVLTLKSLCLNSMYMYSVLSEEDVFLSMR